MGYGSKIRFRQHVWFGDQTLKVASPDLFSISRCKEALVANLLQFSNNALQWTISFIRSVHDWEVVLISLFFNLLHSST